VDQHLPGFSADAARIAGFDIPASQYQRDVAVSVAMADHPLTGVVMVDADACHQPPSGPLARGLQDHRSCALPRAVHKRLLKRPSARYAAAAPTMLHRALHGSEPHRISPPYFSMVLYRSPPPPRRAAPKH
jgi:hypothetical protein